jgi:hypothetical protein
MNDYVIDRFLCGPQPLDLGNLNLAKGVTAQPGPTSLDFYDAGIVSENNAVGLAGSQNPSHLLPQFAQSNGISNIWGANMEAQNPQKFSEEAEISPTSQPALFEPSFLSQNDLVLRTPQITTPILPFTQQELRSNDISYASNGPEREMPSNLRLPIGNPQSLDGGSFINYQTGSQGPLQTMLSGPVKVYRRRKDGRKPQAKSRQQNGQRLRGAFKDQQTRDETALTRKLGACVRCRLQKLRVR